jgi:hypothetical protein
MKWWRGEGSTEYGGKSDEGHPTRLLAELFKTLLVIDAAREFFLTYKWEWPIDEATKIRCWDGRVNRLIEIAHSCGSVKHV